MTGQYSYDRNWVEEREMGGCERERTTRQDSISGHPKPTAPYVGARPTRLSAATLLYFKQMIAALESRSEHKI